MTLVRFRVEPSTVPKLVMPPNVLLVASCDIMVSPADSSSLIAESPAAPLAMFDARRIVVVWTGYAAASAVTAALNVW